MFIQMHKEERKWKREKTERVFEALNEQKSVSVKELPPGARKPNKVRIQLFRLGTLHSRKGTHNNSVPLAHVQRKAPPGDLDSALFFCTMKVYLTESCMYAPKVLRSR
jgi:hypothetical protein